MRRLRPVRVAHHHQVRQQAREHERRPHAWRLEVRPRGRVIISIDEPIVVDGDIVVKEIQMQRN